jgi:hypothetical protein
VTEEILDIDKAIGVFEARQRKAREDEDWPALRIP